MPSLWPALSLSLRIALAATLLTAVLAIPLAFFMARRRFPGQSLLEALITVPLVLPPTVVGYLLILLLGSRGLLGQHLRRAFDYTFLFTFEAATLAAATVSLPLLYMPAKAAFASIDRDLEDIATLSGASRLQIFLRISIPLARRGLFAGLLLAFARSLGEFGATVMVFGQFDDRLTLPILIYSDYLAGESSRALPAVGLLCALSLFVILAYNRSLRD
jgi:molybdate transport system permease protein